MTLTRLTLCALLLLALPAIAVAAGSQPATGDLPVAEVSAAEAVGCSGSLATVETSEADQLQLWLGSAAESSPPPTVRP